MTVNVVSPAGETWAVDEAEARRALANGYRVESPSEAKDRTDEAKYGDRPLAAGVAGALRGATLGLSDVVGDVFGKGLGIDAGTLPGLQKHNATASTVGEGVGTVASLALPGLGAVSGPALAGKVGAAVGRGLAGEGASLAGRALAKGVAGAVEGSFFGAGHALSESVLGDSELTAEKLLSGAGIGFLAGGALGGGASFLGAGVQAGVEKAVGATEGLPAFLKGFAEERAVKASGAMLKDFRGLSRRGNLAEAGRDLLDLGIVTPGANVQTIAERAAAKAEETGVRISDVLSALDAGAKKTELVSAADVAKRIEKEVIAPLRKQPAYSGVVTQLEAEAEKWTAMGDKRLRFDAATELKNGYDDFLNHSVEQTPFKEQLKRVRGIVKDELEKKADVVAARVSPELGSEYREAKRLYGNLTETARRANDRVLRESANRFVSPSDYGTGAAGAVVGAVTHGVTGGLVTGALGTIGNKALRDYGPSLVATAADRLSKSKVLASVAKAFNGAVKERLEASPTAFGAYRGLLTSAAARGADDLLATHVLLAKSDGGYRDVLAQAGFVPESPEETTAIARKSHQLGQVQEALDAHDKRLDAAVGRFLGRQSGASPVHSEAPAGRKERLESYHRQFDAVAALATSPERLASAIQPGSMLTAAAPTVAGIAATKATQAAQYLFSVAPKNPHADVMPALAVPWQPTESQLASWERTVRALDEPASVLSDLRHGTVTRESVAALKAVYPKLLEDVRGRMTERLATLESPLSYRQRAALATLWESPVGEAASPKRTAVYQSAHEAAKQAKQAAESRASHGGGGGNQLATLSQKVEGR